MGGYMLKEVDIGKKNKVLVEILVSILFCNGQAREAIPLLVNYVKKSSVQVNLDWTLKSFYISYPQRNFRILSWLWINITSMVWLASLRQLSTSMTGRWNNIIVGESGYLLLKSNNNYPNCSSRRFWYKSKSIHFFSVIWSIAFTSFVGWVKLTEVKRIEVRALRWFYCDNCFRK